MVRFVNLLSTALLITGTALGARVMAASNSAPPTKPTTVAQVNPASPTSTPSGGETAKAPAKLRPRTRAAETGGKKDTKAMTMKKGSMGEMAEIPTDVMFKFGSSELRPEAVNVLSECAEMIRRDGNKNMQVIGHTDSIGSASYNLGLSKRRAEAVTAWLVDKGGIPKEDLTATGLGESKPKTSNATAKGRAENRRVEVVMPMGGSPHQPMPEAKK
jgi:outer membrane protein OmpA-like peptidoglycan-associated protein